MKGGFILKDLDYICLVNEDGVEEKMRVITFFKIEDTSKEYVVVTPFDEQSDEAYVLRYEEDQDGNETYTTIEDEEEFNLVSETYQLLMDEDIIE